MWKAWVCGKQKKTEKQNREAKQKTKNKVANLNLNLLIITLNGKCLSLPIKTQRLREWI